MKRSVPLLGVVVLLLILCCISAGCTTTDTNLVTNDALNIIGITEDGVDRFLGIPYAEPPIGNLRFAPPVAKEPWTEPLDCTQYRNASVQDPTLMGLNTSISEDCLYLNVWRPADAKEGDNLPVYVWIHGGGWCYGAGSEDLYDGTQFAKDGIIVVTINYRLGTLGYLALDTLMEDYGTAGNWATLDQICALQWVHDNIAKLGGDPNRVTIGGESAGSFNTFALVMSPMAEGLFQQAIMESGTLIYALENKMRLDKALDIGKKIAAHFGADDSEEGLAILRQVDAMELWQIADINIQDLMTGSPYQTYPVYDGAVLPLNDPYKVLTEGTYNRNVTILMGNNLLEGPGFINEQTLNETVFNDYIRKTFREDGYQEVIDYYAAQTNRSLYVKACEILGKSLVTLGSVETEKELAKSGVPLYAYEFNFISENWKLPLHGSELMYVFGQKNTDDRTIDTDERLVSQMMHSYWTNFIKTGNPNGDGLLYWPLYVEGEQTIMQFDSTPELLSTHTNQDVIDFLAPRYFR